MNASREKKAIKNSSMKYGLANTDKDEHWGYKDVCSSHSNKTLCALRRGLERTESSLQDSWEGLFELFCAFTHAKSFLILPSSYSSPFSKR